MRRTIRVPGFDYAGPAAYMVTICAQGRLPLFGRVVHRCLIPSLAGRIVEEEWRRSGSLRAEVVLDASW